MDGGRDPGRCRWFGADFRGADVPRLADVLGMSRRGLELELELKGRGATFLDRVLEVIDQSAPEATIEFTSANVWLLSRLRRLDPKAKIGLFTQRPQPWMTTASFEPAITAPIAGRLHELRLEVHANDVDDAKAIARAANAGADRLSTMDIELARITRK